MIYILLDIGCLFFAKCVMHSVPLGQVRVGGSTILNLFKSVIEHCGLLEQHEGNIVGCIRLSGHGRRCLDKDLLFRQVG